MKRRNFFGVLFSLLLFGLFQRKSEGSERSKGSVDEAENSRKRCESLWIEGSKDYSHIVTVRKYISTTLPGKEIIRGVIVSVDVDELMKEQRNQLDEFNVGYFTFLLGEKELQELKDGESIYR